MLIWCAPEILAIRHAAGRPVRRVRKDVMSFHSFLIEPVVALLAGILILLLPRLLNYVVAVYLIIIGVIGLAPHFQH